jgi:ADP-L-glycero-D-manno-heptose 6-epimerase
MKVLVTGASGFIGYHIATKLVELGHTVYTTTRPNQNPEVGIPLGSDFRNIEIPPIDYLFHEAAITDTKCSDRPQIMKINCDDAIKLFEKAIEKGAKKIIYASSGAVYGNVGIPFTEDGYTNPLNYYGESKLRLDEKAKGMPVVGFRYSNVFGTHEDHKNAMASMVFKIKHSKIAHLFKWGEQSRDWVAVYDVVNANLLALEKGEGIYNIASGFSLSFNQIAKKFNKIISYIDNPLPEQYQNQTLHNIEKAKKELKYDPKISKSLLL